MIEIGFEVIKNLLSRDELQALLTEFNTCKFPYRKGGIRNIDKKSPSVFRLANSERMLHIAAGYLSACPQLVRAIFFHKSPETNWSVAWHQDKTVAVSARCNDPSWGPWSVKEGVIHVQPPLAVLQTMVTIRIHLDDSTIDNGCLKLIPNSHQKGILTQHEIKTLLTKNKAYACEAKRGDALVMSPLLVHSSNKVIGSSFRRILHLEYSSFNLPKDMSWA